MIINIRLDCEWSGQSIVILGTVRIDPPYTAKDCRSLDDDQNGKERLLRMVRDTKLSSYDHSSFSMWTTVRVVGRLSRRIMDSSLRQCCSQNRREQSCEQSGSKLNV